MNPKNHTHPRRNPESGQAIVLMALLMIALIGFLGVAIDGGGLFLLWRNEQNAVDAAVLAASYARCTGNARLLTASELHSKVVSAGLESAEKNGFVHNGTTVNVTVNNPPPDGVGAGNPNFTEVVITADKPSYFIQVVYPGPLRVTNSAVGMCEPYFDPSMVPGLWAGSLDCENTVNWTGSSGYIAGGMFSNDEIKIKGSSGTVIGPVEAVNVIEGHPSTVWDPDNPPVSGVSPRPDPLALDISLYAPGGTIASRVALYKSITSAADDPDFKKQGGSWTWKPSNGRTLEGLYYVEGNVDIGNGVSFGSKGVTFVATGEIQFSGGANVRYYEEVMKEIKPGVRYPGLLLFSTLVSECGGGGGFSIKFSGNSIESLGILYAPKGKVDVSGSSVTMRGSVVADHIDYSGSNGRLIYESSLLPPRPPSIQIAE